MTSQKYAENKLLYADLSYKLRGCCFELYKELGCGHKESIYHKAIYNKLKDKGIIINKEVRIPVKVDNKKVGTYIPDLIVDNKIMIELKAKKFLTKQDRKQFWHYLRVTDYKLGFLINFGKPGGVEIVRRVYDTARKK